MSTQTAVALHNNLSNDFSILKKKKRTSDMVLRVLIIICAFIAVALIAGIIIYVVIRGVPVLIANPNFIIGQRSFHLVNLYALTFLDMPLPEQAQKIPSSTTMEDVIFPLFSSNPFSLPVNPSGPRD